ncbi:MAG: hypothetical protein K2Y25_01100 [Pseudomonadaceae bacterium]|nr:hypothetical protein [Pseudomonadaceae bacterium]
MIVKSVSLLVLFGFFAVGVQAQPVMQPAAQGGILTDSAGITLYTYDSDQPGKSICQGSCLQAWPAYAAEPAAGEVLASEASRLKNGGAQQWAWNGKPLYYFIGDNKPGDRIGDGSADVWHIVKP